MGTYTKPWLSFEQQADLLINERFIAETSFSQVWHLYIFDRQFRLVVLDAIERAEVYFRTQLAYELAGATGAFGFLDPSNLPD